MSKTWTMHNAGNGTAAYWLMMTLLAQWAYGYPRRITFTDSARIREHNHTTCPRYQKSLWGEFKCVALPGLIKGDLPPETLLESYPTRVERLDWPRLLPARDLRCREDAVVFIALDDWNSRLVVIQDIRQWVAEVLDGPAEHVLIITVGLDKGVAQVCTFGTGYEDQCPLCWLPKLPPKEPCVVLDKEKKLLRGDLHQESQAAADLVLRIIADHRQREDGQSEWGDTENHLWLPTAEEPDGSTKKRRRAKAPKCKGPHSPNVPIRWDGTLQSLEAYQST